MIEPPLIELKSVSKKFQLESGAELKVLEGVNLSVSDGDVVARFAPTTAPDDDALIQTIERELVASE